MNKAQTKLIVLQKKENSFNYEENLLDMVRDFCIANTYEFFFFSFIV